MAVILGAGTWGMAIARVLYKNGNNVKVWSHSNETIDYIIKNHHHKNLPFMEVPVDISFESDILNAVCDEDIIVVATPSLYVREVAEQIKSHIKNNSTITVLSKGIEKETLLYMSQVIEEVLEGFTKDISVVVLAGPSHAEEVAKDMPTTIVSACKDLCAAKKVQDIFMNQTFRVYTNDDILGVEFCSAFKNIYALACGISEGLGYGDNIKAAIMTRGLAEMVRLGEKIGYKKSTFFGLAGVGDLIVTGMSQYSRNNRCGKLIGSGMSVVDAIDSVGMVVEGINCLPAAIKLKNKYNVEMPICEGVYSLIVDGKKVDKVAVELMMRDKKQE